jgi:hypothetical protein
MITCPTPKYSLEHRFHVMVPMRDGVRLSTDIAVPQGEGPWPTILMRTPYGNSDPTRHEYLLQLARRGFATAMQDCRGRHDSEGEWEPFRHERDDAFDTIVWLVQQAFCSGSVGMIGRSYQGYCTWVAAPDHHPALKAIVPIVPLPDPVINVPYQNGAPFWNMLIWALMVHGRTNQDVARINWTELYTRLPLRELDRAAGFDSAVWQSWLDHPSFDDWWKEVCYMHRLGSVDLPALHVCGWYDDDGISTYVNFPRMRREAKTEAAREAQRLIIGCWPHQTNASSIVGELDFGPGALIDLDAMVFRFFAKHLAGEDHGLGNDPRCRVFIMGENRWHSFPDWPVPGAVTTHYFLHSGSQANSLYGDGRLSLDAPAANGSPAGETPSDTFTYDPANPVPYVTDPVKLQLGEACDQQSIERRVDVLCYSTPPLSADVVVCGRVFAELYIESDAPATDFTAKLVDVWENGRAIQVCDGVQRAEYRNSLESPEWLEPGNVYKVVVDMWATGLRFLKGHRIRLEVSSSAVPKFARHLNTRDDPAVATEWRVAHQTVHHSAAHPSALILDVLPENLIRDTVVE